ncbi:MAG TPA: twin-arginine translocase TatA/TatE family subunit [Phycisphaeraceae bacterium]|nr:twin-arginine translocase TatA/TatE family subunit [Phycisphaeraceae bacterium]
MPGGYEWVILLALGLLIFGKRLPEVGRNFGKTIVEFKKGIKGIEDDIDTSASRQQISPAPPAQSLPNENQAVSGSSPIDQAQNIDSDPQTVSRQNGE